MIRLGYITFRKIGKKLPGIGCEKFQRRVKHLFYVKFRSIITIL